MDEPAGGIPRRRAGAVYVLVMSLLEIEQGLALVGICCGKPPLRKLPRLTLGQITRRLQEYFFQAAVALGQAGHERSTIEFFPLQRQDLGTDWQRLCPTGFRFVGFLPYYPAFLRSRQLFLQVVLDTVHLRSIDAFGQGLVQGDAFQVQKRPNDGITGLIRIFWFGIEPIGNFSRADPFRMFPHAGPHSVKPVRRHRQTPGGARAGTLAVGISILTLSHGFASFDADTGAVVVERESATDHFRRSIRFTVDEIGAFAAQNALRECPRRT